MTDHLGTPQELYDNRRRVVWAADFTAYGKMRRVLKQEVDNPIRFPGQYFDAESGLHYNRFRYYDAQAGRYVNQDPIGLLGGTNTYAYAENRPSIATDALGLAAAVWNGAQIGAEVGTAVEPGVGTAIGGVLGGLIGLGALGVMMLIPSSSSSDGARQAEYERAKRFCDTPPPPGSNECSTLSKQIDHAEQCIDMYESWDRKWLPGRHAEKLSTWNNRLRNLKSQHKKDCTQKCPQSFRP
ncbi:RHS repeat domain-containing protein [Burkholderia sp. 8Y]|uniref:RHS repeat domain-containing protein n=1 Tax=Burkholderia sp. 8Y TaxID=2653133 RepID=UPI001359594D|nr:RHS repeat-associated core domain-containing protein [Burkholderia sp. 8Y]